MHGFAVGYGVAGLIRSWLFCPAGNALDIRVLAEKGCGERGPASVGTDDENRLYVDLPQGSEVDRRFGDEAKFFDVAEIVMKKCQHMLLLGTNRFRYDDVLIFGCQMLRTEDA